MGAHIVFAQQVVALETLGDEKLLRLLDGTCVRAAAVVVATGVEWRRLGVPSVERLVGHGVFYGAAAGETRAMQGQDVFIVGAGNSAGQAALSLAKHARTVTLLVRGPSYANSMSTYLVKEIESTPNVVVRNHTEVVDALGDGGLERIALADRAGNTVDHVAATALFVMIGGEPHTQWLPAEIARDPQGYVLTGRDVLEQAATALDPGHDPLPLETSMRGVFAAGDVRTGSIKRVASAVGEGATVVRLVHERLNEREHAGESSRAASPSRSEEPCNMRR
ncbi:MAG: NAD(P)/FAD-dependent oxidoreductase [Actinobacteria bacterium]|nr:NAD(P)/FAD-dependent oxidoreductase [Actinomycetota bacterium]